MHRVARRAAEFGVEVDGSVRFNIAQAVERKDEIVRGIIGGGYVGVEFAQMYARFGTDVRLIGRNDQLAPGEDRELTELLVSYRTLRT